MSSAVIFWASIFVFSRDCIMKVLSCLKVKLKEKSHLVREKPGGREITTRVATHPGKPGKSGEKILALESQGIFR